MKEWIRKHLRRLALWLIERDLNEVRRSLRDTIDFEVRSLDERMHKELTALQAIDVGFKEAGKLILMARVNGQDVVKFFDVPPTWTLRDYKAFSDRIDAEYGAQARFIDAGHALESVWRRM